MLRSAEVMHTTGDDIDVAYNTLGEATAPPVVLISGLGAQLIAWDDAFCQQLVIEACSSFGSTIEMSVSRAISLTVPRLIHRRRRLVPHRQPPTRSLRWRPTRRASSTTSDSALRMWSGSRWAG